MDRPSALPASIRRTPCMPASIHLITFDIRSSTQVVQGFLRPLPGYHHHHHPSRRRLTMTTATTAAPPAGVDDNCRHLYGYGNPNHKDSILQTITKCVFLLLAVRILSTRHHRLTPVPPAILCIHIQSTGSATPTWPRPRARYQPRSWRRRSRPSTRRTGSL